MSFVWRGDTVLSNLQAAAAAGIDATMAAAVLHAKSGHGRGAHGSQRFETQTGELERATRIIDPAKRIGKATVGRWGSLNNIYARRIELGFQGQDARGRSVHAPAYPFLFPAARAEYPKLVGRIKGAL